jgi:uncharacterized membrane protein YfcA
MITLSLHITLFLLITSFIAGYIDAIAGGSGLIMVPVLLTLGLPPHLALGTNKFGATLGVMNSTIVFLRRRLYNPRFWISALIFSILGSALGVICVQYVKVEWLGKIIPAIMLAIFIYMLFPKNLRGTISGTDYRPPKLGAGILGSILGFYDGFFGPGTGAFWTSALVIFFKLDLLKASAIARLMNFVSNAVALLFFMHFGLVNYHIGLILAIGLMTGSFIGAKSALRFGSNFIRPFFLIIVAVLIVKLTLKYWF